MASMCVSGLIDACGVVDLWNFIFFANQVHKKLPTTELKGKDEPCIFCQKQQMLCHFTLLARENCCAKHGQFFQNSQEKTTCFFFQTNQSCFWVKTQKCRGRQFWNQHPPSVFVLSATAKSVCCCEQWVDWCVNYSATAHCMAEMENNFLLQWSCLAPAELNLWESHLLCANQEGRCCNVPTVLSFTCLLFSGDTMQVSNEGKTQQSELCWHVSTFIFPPWLTKRQTSPQWSGKAIQQNGRAHVFHNSSEWLMENRESCMLLFQASSSPVSEWENQWPWTQWLPSSDEIQQAFALRSLYWALSKPVGATLTAWWWHPFWKTDEIEAWFLMEFVFSLSSMTDLKRINDRFFWLVRGCNSHTFKCCTLCVLSCHLTSVSFKLCKNVDPKFHSSHQTKSLNAVTMSLTATIQNREAPECWQSDATRRDFVAHHMPLWRVHHWHNWSVDFDGLSHGIQAQVDLTTIRKNSWHLKVLVAWSCLSMQKRRISKQFFAQT